MARYIDADKLIEAIEKDIEPYKSWDCTKFDVVMDTILEAPTADVVEVVRCKNCQKFKLKGEDISFEDVYGVCERTITGFFDGGEEVYGNDFCSYGKRRDT